LSECSAGASQNNRRNTRYPEIPLIHVYSLPPLKSLCRDGPISL
jgi:hypothetical protein